VVLFRAWFRYLRQTGPVLQPVDRGGSAARAPNVARSLVALFDATHDPSLDGGREAAVAKAEETDQFGPLPGAAIDEDRILRLIRGVVVATLRTNAYAPSGKEALAFKLDSSLVPGLPAPLPWREIWVYSPRVEGIHLRAARSPAAAALVRPARTIFDTEILGLMKAQVVKNAVIVPTGAKGGFYPKQLPPMSDRDAWMKEGTESYRIFIRSLLSVTDNIVDGKIIHPNRVTIRDGDDPYFVVPPTRAPRLFRRCQRNRHQPRLLAGRCLCERRQPGLRPQGDGITARGGWVSVQRHFRELGVDVQTQPIRVVGIGDMSGDVFGNGMLLSKAIKLVAAFDHRHIFFDPNPDPARSWEERDRLFKLPRSSWADYDAALISAGGGIFPRTQKAIPLSPEVRAMLGVEVEEMDPAGLINAILKAPPTCSGSAGSAPTSSRRTRIMRRSGDPGNDPVRVNAAELRVKAIGEGANLAITQAGRIEFAQGGGRANTDFIDNSAGVDCSDNEVNIKIPLNRRWWKAALPRRTATGCSSR
jgi:glutamate dehydrogenase